MLSPMAKRNGTGGAGASRGGAPEISLAEYAARRERVLGSLDGAIGLVFAGESSAHLRGVWRPNLDFYYLTGMKDEQGAALLLDPGAPDPSRRAILFLRPLNPELDIWDGLRDPISGSLRARAGLETVLRTTHMPRAVTGAARLSKKAACLHPFATYDGSAGPDLALFRKLSERIVGLSIVDKTQVLPAMRAVKSKAELACMGRAIEATAAGFAAGARAARAGANERDVQRAVEGGFASKGCHATAYNSIVGSGVRGVVLHYNANDQAMRDGELLVIDAGAEYAYYAADVTRTFPVGGKFTREGRELYELVLEAQRAAIRAVRAGVWMWEVDAAAKRVFEKAGMLDHYPHGIGHQLGLEVHDSTPDGPLKAGMVVTIEPGLYLKDRSMGVRIEDDVLVTAKGSENLTAMIPKEAGEVEAMVRG